MIFAFAPAGTATVTKNIFWVPPKSGCGMALSLDHEPHCTHKLPPFSGVQLAERRWRFNKVRLAENGERVCLGDA